MEVERGMLTSLLHLDLPPPTSEELTTMLHLDLPPPTSEELTTMLHLDLPPPPHLHLIHRRVLA